MTSKCVMVTGCSSGIGLATCYRLTNLGYEVIASARRIEDVWHLRKIGFKAVQLDASCEESTINGFNEAIDISDHKEIWGLFINAGYGQSGALEDLSRQAFREQFETNLFGAHQIAQLGIRHMVEKNIGGRIAFCSSVLGIVAMQLRGAYVSSKFAMEGMCDTLRMEMKRYEISICIIEPGPVKTNFRKNSLEAFNKNVNQGATRRRDQYLRLVAKLSKEGAAVPGTISSEECAAIVCRAFTDRKPKARYRATFSTYLFSILKRVLTTKMMDFIASRG